MILVALCFGLGLPLLAQTQTDPGAEIVSNAGEDLDVGEFLVIESIEPIPGEDAVNVVLRNVSPRAVTAWCLQAGGGPGDGSTSYHRTSCEDRYAEGVKDLADPDLPIEPGDTVTYRLDVEGVSVGPDRFDEGDYSVLSVRVGAVFLDDGTYAGPARFSIDEILLRRVAQVRAALRFQRDLEDWSDIEGKMRWLRDLVEKTPKIGTVPAPVFYSPPREELLIAHEEQAYRHLAGDAGRALVLHDKLGKSKTRVIGWLNSRLTMKIENGFKNLPASLYSEALQ